MGVIVKKDEKLDAIFNTHGLDIELDEFIEIFKKEYPNDWERIKKKFRDEERKTKPGKSHPMPEGNKFLENAYKVYKNKLKK